MVTLMGGVYLRGVYLKGVYLRPRGMGIRPWGGRAMLALRRYRGGGYARATYVCLLFFNAILVMQGQTPLLLMSILSFYHITLVAKRVQS